MPHVRQARLSAACVLLFGGAVFAAPPDTPIPFVGTWKGMCEGTGVPSAEVELVVKEEKNGTLTGTWAGRPVRGERLGRGTCYFETANKEAVYRMAASVEDGKLVVNYSVAPHDGGKKLYGAGTLEAVGTDRAAAEWLLTLFATDGVLGTMRLSLPDKKSAHIRVSTDPKLTGGTRNSVIVMARLPEGTETVIKQPSDLPAEKFKVKEISVSGKVKVEASGMRTLSGLSELKMLSVKGDVGPLTDEDVANLAGCPALEVLDLSDASLTDAGLKHLRGATKLQELYLPGTKVTDAGLESLTGLTELRRLWVTFTPVTKEGADKLKNALPKCEIVR